MKNTNKAFTLVELIVVITILAVLATVAFISLTGHAQDAKNSKVASDLATVTSGLETAMTQGKANVKNAITANATILTANTVDNGVQVAAGEVIDDTASTGNYSVGLINFAQIGQNGEGFKYSNDNAYLYAYFATGAVAQYQVAGQITEASGNNTSMTRGNYYAATPVSDVAGLVSASGSVTPLTNKGDMGTASIY